MSPPTRHGAPAVGPLHRAPNGAYVLTTDTAVTPNPTPAVGFTSTPPGTPNPGNQQTTGQIIASTTRASALVLQAGGAPSTVWYFLGALPSYFGYADVRVFEEETDAADDFPEVIRLVVTNGRTQSVPSGQAALIAMVRSLTFLAAPAQFGQPIAHSLGFPGSDGFTANDPNGLRVWLPPGQNDLWVAVNYFDPNEAALLWFTVIASPATEAAIAGS